jgi:hypothetical protein
MRANEFTEDQFTAIVVGLLEAFLEARTLFGLATVIPSVAGRYSIGLW